MKISVAMATYNGEKYIYKQLESILNQTIPVDEIIVSDDGSKDSTLKIVESFNDPRILIITDNPNHGYCGNFEWAIKHCTGDYIFLSDQDDIWVPTKVSETLDFFHSYPEAQLVISDGSLIDKDDNPIEGKFNRFYTFANQCGKLTQEQYLEQSTYNTLANGMCMCFPSSFKDEIIPFPSTRIFHDTWIAFCALNIDSCYYINQQLVKYRLHDYNASLSVSSISNFISFSSVSLVKVYTTRGI